MSKQCPKNIHRKHYYIFWNTLPLSISIVSLEKELILIKTMSKESAYIFWYIFDLTTFNLSWFLRKILNMTTSKQHNCVSFLKQKQEGNLPSGGHGSQKYSPLDGVWHGHHRLLAYQTMES